MIRWLRYQWFEYKRRNEVMRVDMQIRSHPKARDDHFNRYAAIGHVMRELEMYGMIYSRHTVEIDKDGMWIIPSIRRKHFLKYLEIAGRVK